MKNKHILLTGILILVPVLVIIYSVRPEQSNDVQIKIIQNNSERTESKKHEISQLNPNILTNEDHSISANKERSDEVRTLIDYIEEQERLGLQVGKKPEDGMADHRVLINSAFQTGCRSTTSTSRAPDITLINDIYIVSLWRHSNPFRAGDDGFDSRLGFDAWTGEYIAGISSKGGRKFFA